MLFLIQIQYHRRFVAENGNNLRERGVPHKKFSVTGFPETFPNIEVGFTSFHLLNLQDTLSQESGHFHVHLSLYCLAGRLIKLCSGQISFSSVHLFLSVST